MNDQPDLFSGETALERIEREHMAHVRATIRGSERAICPVCHRLDKMYRRKLARHQALALLWFDTFTDEDEWFHVQQKGPLFMVRDPCWKWSKHWGFVEQQPNDDPSKRDSGCWRITVHGRLFARGHTTAWSHALIYRDEAIEFDGESVRIDDLVDGFHYEKLMAGEW
jgi:hypothetical protein